MSDLATFRECGYVHIKSCFPKELVEAVAHGAVDCGAPRLPTMQHVFQPSGSALFPFDPLFSNSRLVDFAHNALCANVKLSLLEYVQTPPEEKQYEGDQINLGWSNQTRLGVHRDGAWLDEDLAVSIPPMLTLKAAIWLSNVAEGDGGLRLWPRSHLLPRPVTLAAAQHLDVNAAVGDVTFFDRRIFHTRTHNVGTKTRRVVYIEYSVTWIKRKQFFAVEADTLDALSPMGSSLLKDPSDPWRNYWP